MSKERMGFLQGFEKIQLNKEERAQRLAQNKWAEVLGVDSDEVAQLAEYLIPYTGYANAVVFSRGEDGSFMCLVISGGINIYKSEAKNALELIASVGPENTVGEMALIDGEPRSAYAYASCQTVLFIMTRSNFLRLSEDHPLIWGKLVLKIARLLSSRLRKSNEVVEILQAETSSNIARSFYRKMI